MNDSRWPWLILVPVHPDIEEIHDLTQAQRESFMADVNKVSQVVQTCTDCQSVNVAMLGNVVAQLHCHVVARNPGDPNWPGPIWGFESAIPYADGENEVHALKTAIQSALSS
jgi:diadenosine tetraphosphate (Ap4A) HIT family hydrolase